MKIHHLGYLVENIEKSLEALTPFGFEITTCIYDKNRAITICFIKKDEYCIELISPDEDAPGFSSLMKKSKNMAYHICYELENKDNELHMLLSAGWILVQPFSPAPAIDGHNVSFYLHPSAGIIELLDLG